MKLISRSKGWQSLVVAACSLLVTQQVWSQDRVIHRPAAGETFATLPPEANFPEGIAADPQTGDIFVGTFDAPPDGSGTNFLLRFDRTGRRVAQLSLGLVPATGLAFNPRDRQIYIARPGGLLGLGSFIQRVPANFGPTTVVETVAVVPNLGAPGPRTETTLDGQQISISFPDTVPAPNGIAFRASDGALFFTDSLQAAVLRIADPTRRANICPTTSACVQLVKQSPLFASATFPQLGANGLTLSTDESTLFVTNTGDDRLLSLRLQDATVSVVAESLEGADGIVNGPNNTLIVSRALGDELAVLDATSGRILAEFGEFRGIRPDGSVRGLLFPGSIVLVGNTIFANNLALPLSGSPAEPELDVRVYTVSRVDVPSLPPR